MPILDTELKLYRSATVSDGDANGGRMSTAEITSGAMSNIFPAVGESERTAGSTKYRKVHPKVANDDDLTLYSGKVYLDQYTLGDDMVRFFEATHTDTQDDITGSEKKYGCGKLDANVSAGATSVDVLVEDGGDHPFEDGDTIRLADYRILYDSPGTEEYALIDGTPSVAGDVVTLPLAAALENGFSASTTRVMNVMDAGDVAATVDTLNVTSAAGTVDISKILPDFIGAVRQTITLTFTSGTAYNITGDTLGSLGSGNVGSGASPNNANFSKPYFVIQAAAFGGTFLSGDVVTFELYPASVPVWLERIVPAGADDLASNEAVLVLDGDTSNA